jgi:hypothetical protein
MGHANHALYVRISAFIVNTQATVLLFYLVEIDLSHGILRQLKLCLGNLIVHSVNYPWFNFVGLFSKLKVGVKQSMPPLYASLKSPIE